MSNPSLNDLKQKVKDIRINNYKNISNEKLLSALDELGNYGENNFNNARQKGLEIKFDRIADEDY